MIYGQQFVVTNLDTGESLDLRCECLRARQWSTFCPSPTRQHAIALTQRLWAAVDRGDCTETAAALAAGASVHAKGLHAWTALHIAAARGHCAIAEVLLQHEAFASDQSQSGQTPLHLAAASGSSDVVALLLRWETNMKTRDNSGNTPLHLAAQSGHEEVVRCLLANSADCSAQNNSGETPGDVAGNAAVRSLLPPHSSYSRSAFDSVVLRNGRRDGVARLLDGPCISPVPYVFFKERLKNHRQRKLAEYRLLAELGAGSFAKVFLAKRGSRYFALKVMEKAAVGKELARYVLTERNILSRVRHPFIVRMHCTFQTSSHLVLVLDYCGGGTLSELLQREGRLREARAKTLVCELVLALRELHSHQIIYRDLKPANVLLTAEGHAVLSDFGLAKEGVASRMVLTTMCGTPAYLSPEMVTGAGHSYGVDWYSLGVLLYHMLTGLPPFLAETQEKLFSNIATGKLSIPWHVAPSTRNFIERLMDKDPSARLGFHGAAEVMQHAFFRKVDWSAVLRRECPVSEPRPDPLKKLSETVDLDSSANGADLSRWSFSS